jgi:hypothetical protein
MAKSPPPTARGMTHDGLTASHIANRIGAVPLQKGLTAANEQLTTAHLARGLAQGQAGSSSSAVQGTNSQTPTSGAAANQSGTTGKS